MKTPLKEISDRLEILFEHQLGDDVYKAIASYPPILYASEPKAMRQLAASLTEFFTRKQVGHVDLKILAIFLDQKASDADSGDHLGELRAIESEV